MQIRAGAKMTQMEHRLVVARFKDGYGPVGMWFLLFKSPAKNSYGEIAEETRAHELEEWAPYGTAKPVPTPLRNHLMLNEIKEGLGPHYLRTDEALQRMFVEVQNDPKKIAEIESDAWEDFLDMTMSQAHIWASQNIDPSKTALGAHPHRALPDGLATPRPPAPGAPGRRTPPPRATTGATTG